MAIKWCMVPEILSITDRFFLSFWTIFCPFITLTTQNIKILKKLQKTWIYYHLTHVYHKLQSYDVWFLRYRVWWTEFFVVLDKSLPIYPLKSRKIKILKKWKKCQEILSFYTSVPKIRIICYTVPQIWCMADVIIFHFGLFFALLPPPTSPKIKIKKNEKKAWRYNHFTHVHQKLWLDDVQFQRNGAQQTDRRTDRRTDGKSDT